MVAAAQQVAPPPPATTGATDFDLAGVVGIRLLGSSRRDADAVERQLGPIRRPLDRAPDVLVSFVDRLPLRGDLRLVGQQDAGFTDDAFLVLRGPHKSSVRAQVRFPQRDEPVELTCETGLAAVPLLVPIVNLVALRAGLLPLHASAFVYEGRGVLATGWAKGGKTEALLGFMARGASYVGDEWVYLLPDGSLAGIPEPIRVWDTHLRDLPDVRRRLGLRRRLALRTLAAASAAGDPVRRRRPGGYVNRGLALLDGQRNVRVPPAELFGAEACALRGPLDTLLFVVSHDSPATVVHQVDAASVARRMEFSLRFERLDLLAAYLKFRFAFPDAASALVDSAEERQRELLARSFSGRRAFEVRHPYPAPIPALVDAVEPLLVG